MKAMSIYKRLKITNGFAQFGHGGRYYTFDCLTHTSDTKARLTTYAFAGKYMVEFDAFNDDIMILLFVQVISIVITTCIAVAAGKNCIILLRIKPCTYCSICINWY